MVLSDAQSVAQGIASFDLSLIGQGLKDFLSLESSLSSSMQTEAQQLFQDAVLLDYLLGSNPLSTNGQGGLSLG